MRFPKAWALTLWLAAGVCRVWGKNNTIPCFLIPRVGFLAAMPSRTWERNEEQWIIAENVFGKFIPFCGGAPIKKSSKGKYITQIRSCPVLEENLSFSQSICKWKQAAERTKKLVGLQILLYRVVSASVLQQGSVLLVLVILEVGGQWLQQLWGSMRSGEQRISEPDAAAMDWECHPGTTLGQPSALLNLSSSMFPSVFLYLCFYLQCTLYCIMYFCISIFWKMSPKTKWPTFRLPLFLNRPNEWKLIFFNVILVIYVLFLPFLLLCTMCLFHRVLTYDVWFAADRESSEEKKHMDWNCVFSQNCY